MGGGRLPRPQYPCLAKRTPATQWNGACIFVLVGLEVHWHINAHTHAQGSQRVTRRGAGRRCTTAAWLPPPCPDVRQRQNNSNGEQKCSYWCWRARKRRASRVLPASAESDVRRLCVPLAWRCTGTGDATWSVNPVVVFIRQLQAPSGRLEASRSPPSRRNVQAQQGCAASLPRPPARLRKAACGNRSPPLKS